MESALAAHAARRGALSTKIVVFTRDAPGVLLSVSSAVTEHSENIIDVHSETQAVGVSSAFQYSISIHSLEQLDELEREVRLTPSRRVVSSRYGSRPRSTVAARWHVRSYSLWLAHRFASGAPSCISPPRHDALLTQVSHTFIPLSGPLTLLLQVCKLDDVVRVKRGSMQDMMHDNPTDFWDMARPSEP